METDQEGNLIEKPRTPPIASEILEEILEDELCKTCDIEAACCQILEPKHCQAFKALKATIMDLAEVTININMQEEILNSLLDQSEE